MSAAQEILDALRSYLGENQPPVVDVATLATSLDKRTAVLVVRDGYNVRQVAGPKRLRRTHQFADVTSFAEWLNRHVPGSQREEAEVLVARGGAGKAPVAFASVPHADGLGTGDRVSCLVAFHPSWTAWVEACGAVTTQKELLAFIRAHRDEAELSDVLIAELRKLSVLRNDEVSAELDVRGFTAFASKTARVTVEGALPGSFVVTVPVFLDSDPVRLEVQLSLEVAHDEDDEPELHLALSSPSVDLVQHEATMALVQRLRSLLEPEFLVGLGAMAWEEVAEALTT